MKKAVSLVIALMLMFTLVFTFSSCSQYYNCKKAPASSIKDAVKKYENDGYVVMQLSKTVIVDKAFPI